MMKRAVVAVSLTSALGAQTAADRRQFIACPIVRDTKTAPCWLAEFKGETYFLGIQGGVADEFYPPQLDHMALIEGTVDRGARVCGGIPLRQVKVSVLAEINPACNTILPAEDGIEAPARQRVSGPPPAWVKIEGPDAATLYYDFDSDFHSLHINSVIAAIAKRAKETPGARVEVTGYRGATLLSDGSTLIEKTGMGEIRARKVAQILQGLGVAEDAITVKALADAVKADGVNDPWNRRVEIAVRR